MPRIVVCGSINMDLVVRCTVLPARGETIIANQSSEICGGKGANQAIAAAKVGGDVSFIGRVGDDVFSSRLVENLNQHRIDCTHVTTTVGSSSGVAVVAVEQSGENSIMVVPGANGRVTRTDVEAAAATIQTSDVLLLQLEIPSDAVVTALQIAKHAGVRVILDPAPAPKVFPNEFFEADALVPNQSEAAAILGIPVETVADGMAAVEQLALRGVAFPVITMGSQGAVFGDGETIRSIEPFGVTAVDTTAAGDAFAGALAVAWAEGQTLADSMRMACASGAIASTRLGAQPSMPTRAEVNAFL
ncbi:Ribokinase [Planctomycetes bacterium CA13]|uniref:Ribokinase n=1 Tax=Novipirellula herctigrandis TaxID=2527986 RepID=A0A5C5ZD39_9BACT|nr:Ribokinase [Planctomycetes bacterium CA13]